MSKQNYSPNFSNKVVNWYVQLSENMYNFLIEKRRLSWFLALSVLLLAVITRIVPPLTPQTGMVFDESYFVPQSESYIVNRYYFDPHPPLGKFFLYLGASALNPDAASKIEPEKLGNLVNGYQTPLTLEGIRLAPRIFGSLVPVLVFWLCLQLIYLGRKQMPTSQYIAANLLAFMAGVMAALDNSLIVESRYALLTQLMLFWMLAALLLIVMYCNAKRYFWTETLFILGAFSVGAAVSVKWLALSIVPVIVLIVLWRELSLFWNGRYKLRGLISILIQRGLFLGLAALMVYLGTFVWHFNQIKHYSPAADELSEPYKTELQTGERQVGFMYKVNEWHHFARNYAKGVPALDYTKKDEIGSMWLTWPIMARPINYYWQTDGDGLYGIIYLIGNPAVWLLSLVGVVGIGAMGIARLLGKNKFRFAHLLLLLLFFGNWLPFALITRVMYLYHYIPAMVFGIVLFALFIFDFVVPRIHELSKYAYWKWIFNTNTKLIFYILTVLMVFFTFVFYSPFTYAKDLSKSEWQQRVLLKEWNMSWPGGDSSAD